MTYQYNVKISRKKKDQIFSTGNLKYNCLNKLLGKKIMMIESEIFQINLNDNSDSEKF